MARPLIAKLEKLSSVGSRLRSLKPAAIGGSIAGGLSAATTRRQKDESGKSYAKRIATNAGVAATGGAVAGHFGTKAFRAGVTRVGKEARRSARHALHDASIKGQNLLDQASVKGKELVDHTAQRTAEIGEQVGKKNIDYAVDTVKGKADEATKTLRKGWLGRRLVGSK